MESFSGEREKNDVSTSSERAGFRGMIGQVSFLFYLPSLLAWTRHLPFLLPSHNGAKIFMNSLFNFKKPIWFISVDITWFFIIYDWKCRSLTKVDFRVTLCCESIRSSAFLWCKMPMFWGAKMREGGKSLPLAFQYLIFMV